MSYFTVNYLFAAYLQTTQGGNNKIVRVEPIKPGKAKFYFDIDDATAKKKQLEFNTSCCLQFEERRRATINLAY